MRNFVITGGGMVNKGAQAMTLIAVHELRRRFPGHEIYLYSPVDLANPALDTSVYKFRFTGWYPLKFARCQKNFLLRLVTRLRNGAELKEAEAILERIRRLLPGVKVIFAREQEGYDALVDTFGLTNVRLAKDLVLASREIEPENVFTVPPVPEVSDVPAECVGLIPNSMNLKAADTDAVLSTYAGVIRTLLDLGKTVCILSHSSMDAELCRTLKGQFADDDRVLLPEQELSSLEFNVLVKQLQYVVGSRFHSIVHAFKNGVPCIALGWATKYHDLLKLFGQEPYIFDVRDPHSAENIGAAIARMDQVWPEESKKIRAALAEVQRENVFDILGAKVHT